MPLSTSVESDQSKLHGELGCGRVAPSTGVNCTGTLGAVVSAPPPPTTTDIVFDTQPLELVACSVNVVEAAGVVTRFPETSTTAIDPPPEIMFTVVALDVFQLRVVDPPKGIIFGLASKYVITGRPSTGAGPATASVMCEGTLPAEFVAVSTYVVVPAGVTARVPDMALTLPMPGSIDAEVAPEIFQLSTALPPLEIVSGVTVNEIIEGNEPDGVEVPVTIT